MRKRIDKKCLTCNKIFNAPSDQAYCSNKCSSIHSQIGKHKKPKSILDLSNRTTCKILRRLNVKCSNCGFDKVHGDVHHIISKKNGGTDKNTNLVYLCPNCHRMAHNNLIKKYITIDKQIGNKWKKVYFG